MNATFSGTERLQRWTVSSLWTAALLFGVGVGCAESETDGGTNSEAEESALPAELPPEATPNYSSEMKTGALSTALVNSASAATVLVDTVEGWAAGRGGASLQAFNMVKAAAVPECASFTLDGGAIVLALVDCEVGQAPSTLNGDASVVWQSPELTADASLKMAQSGAVVDVGMTATWTDLKTNPKPELVLSAAYTDDAITASITEMVLVRTDTALEGEVAFELSTDSWSIASTEGVTVVVDTTAAMIDGPLAVNLSGLELEGEAHDLYLAYEDQFPSAGGFATSIVVLGWTVVSTTWFQESTPDTSWVLVNDHSEKVISTGDLIEFDVWTCRNLDTQETQPASEDALCPVE